MVKELSFVQRQSDARKEYAQTFKGLIPAQPGWFLIDFFGDTTTGETFNTPIVAWELLTDAGVGIMRPVTFETINESYFILAPDGQVFDPENSSWENVTAFVRSHLDDKKKEKSNGLT